MLKQIRTTFNLLSLLTSVWIAFMPTAHAQVVDLSDHPHGHDCASAADIILNTKVPARLLASDDYAVYRMTLTQRGLLDVWTDAGAFDAWDMELLDSSCERFRSVIGDTSLVTSKWTRLTVPHKAIYSGDTSVWTLASGVYYVKIRPNPMGVFEEDFNFYTKFTAHYGHDCATAEALKLPASIRGEVLYAEDREVFRVTISQSGLLHTWTTGELASPKEPSILLYSENCSAVIEQQRMDPEGGIVTSVLSPGTYYVAVEPWQPDYLGQFTLHVEFIYTASVEDGASGH